MVDAFLFAEPFIIILSTILICILPGWLIACCLNLNFLDRSVTYLLISFTLIYLIEFGTYLLSLPSWFPFVLLMMGSLIAVIFLSRRGRKNLLKDTFPWGETLAWLVLSLWGLAIQFKIVVYGAQWAWAVDWFEHYERSLFFVDQLPPETKFGAEIWTLPARGPLFNSVAGLMMGGLGKEFWSYQIIATVLNTFPAICLALLIQNISGLKRLPALLWSVAIFAIAPFAVQQVIYPWTKMFTTGLILTGIHYYIKGAQRADKNIMAWAFFPFALGMLAHYMTILFAVFFLIHFIYTALKTRWNFRIIIYPLGSCFLILSTWLVFLIVNFGFIGLFTDKNTLGGKYAEDFHKRAGISLTHGEIVWWNTLHTLVPYSVRKNWNGLGSSPDAIKQGWPLQPKKFSAEELEGNRKIIWKLDLINNQSTLPGNIGWAGFVALFIVILNRRKNLKNKGNFQKAGDTYPLGYYFWGIFIIFGMFILLFSIKVFSPQGISYATFQPFLCLIIVLLLKELRNIPKLIKFSLVGIFVVESAFKTYIWIQMHTRQVTLEISPGLDLVIRGPGLNKQYVGNYLAKVSENFLYLSDRFGEFSGLLSLICVGFIISILALCARYQGKMI